MFDLRDENFLLYAAHHYESPHYLTNEFVEDLKRIKYIKRLLNKYRMTKELKERLVLNHIIILSNVFGVECTVNMLFFKCEEDDYPVLKTMLIYLNYLPDQLKVTFNGDYIRQEEIPVDLFIAGRLRAIKST